MPTKTVKADLIKCLFQETLSNNLTICAISQYQILVSKMISLTFNFFSANKNQYYLRDPPSNSTILLQREVLNFLCCTSNVQFTYLFRPFMQQH